MRPSRARASLADHLKVDLEKLRKANSDRKTEYDKLNGWKDSLLS